MISSLKWDLRRIDLGPAAFWPQRATQTCRKHLTVHYWDYPTVSEFWDLPAAGLAGSPSEGIQSTHFSRWRGRLPFRTAPCWESRGRTRASLRERAATMAQGLRGGDLRSVGSNCIPLQRREAQMATVEIQLIAEAGRALTLCLQSYRNLHPSNR